MLRNQSQILQEEPIRELNNNERAKGQMVEGAKKTSPSMINYRVNNPMSLPLSSYLNQLEKSSLVQT